MEPIDVDLEARVVTRRVECFTDTLCAVETVFGWVLQGVGSNVNHRLSSRNISAPALFLACSDDWCTEVLPREPSDIWRLDAIGITDGQDNVRKHPALIHFRSTDALKLCLGQSSLSYEELLTVLAEVEKIVNYHPLTQLCENAEDSEALTPSQFLTGKRLVRLPGSTSGRLPSSTAHELRRRVTYRDKLLHRLWTRLKKEYSLILRSTHHCQPLSSSQLHVGDLVVVRDDNVPDLQWKFGRVVEAFQAATASRGT
ncbi:hypothetical protein MRX96_026866 [Rhipicephalus microplus]